MKQVSKIFSLVTFSFCAALTPMMADELPHPSEYNQPKMQFWAKLTQLEENFQQMIAEKLFNIDNDDIMIQTIQEKIQTAMNDAAQNLEGVKE